MSSLFIMLHIPNEARYQATLHPKNIHHSINFHSNLRIRDHSDQ
ncbi:uncharacterized protein METZ01_LOCUS226069 [marine metagenome]|uniref:Uncharacterized protein n=1 Tax=marine metagenome TaxID=408172 RepID=A0A382GEQ3_9ZZZZ